MLSEQIAALKRYDSATIFNAVALKLGLPNLDYTDHTIRCLLPDLGLVAGFAVTAEVTTNDEDSTAPRVDRLLRLPWQPAGAANSVVPGHGHQPGAGRQLW